MWLENLWKIFIINWMVWFFFKKNSRMRSRLQIKKIIYFNWRLITLQYCGVFCHTSTWIGYGYTCIPPSWMPLPLPPHPMPLGCPGALALSALLHALNLYWSSILHMKINTFQCCSLKSSHPCILSHSPKVCIYIWVSWCLAYRIIVSI